MDLVFMAAVVALSCSLGLAGARAVLWLVLCLMAPPTPVSHMAERAIAKTTAIHPDRHAPTSIAA